MRPSYRRAVRFIAANDEPSETDVGAVKTLLSVVAVSEAFGVTPEKVANDVLALRASANHSLASQ